MLSVCRKPIFDNWIAEWYEILWPELFDRAVVDPTVDFLAYLAGTGPALELGVGIGRITLPLSRRGVSECAFRRRCSYQPRIASGTARPRIGVETKASQGRR